MAKKHEPRKTPITIKKPSASMKPVVPEKVPVSTIKSRALTKTKKPEKVRVPEKPVPVHEKPVPVHEKPVPVHEKPVPVHEKPVPVHEKPARKPRVSILKKPVDIESLPGLTAEQTQAYLKFSESCKEIYDKFSKTKMDVRVAQLKTSPALVAVIRFMVMTHDLLELYGVMQFNKNVAPILYKHLDDVQEETGQKLPLARVLLDGIKWTKMELLSGVTHHPLPDFEEPEYKTRKVKIPDPVTALDEPEDKTMMPDQEEEDFEPQETYEDEGFEPPVTPGEMPSHVGPGGPDFDDSIKPQTGTPFEPPTNLPVSTEEEEELEEEPAE
jgi:hypothetical protein